eukprot:2410989-Amphidinium_carterae.1
MDSSLNVVDALDTPPSASGSTNGLPIGLHACRKSWIPQQVQAMWTMRARVAASKAAVMLHHVI